MLEVRKPFSPLDFEDEKKRKIKENEEEEKPVESTSETTEETHGGEESTESIEDSENPAEADESEQQSSSKSKNEELNSSDNSGDESQDSNEEKNSEGDDENSVNENEGDETNDNNTQGGDIDDNGEADETEAEFDSEQDDNGGTSETEYGDMNPEAYVEDNSEDDQDSEDQDEDQDDQMHSYNYNTEEVVVIDANKKSMSASARYFATKFWRFIESFAEEKMKIYDSTEPEEYNVKKLMFRAYERKPLNAYMQKRVRETVILILDNSGSMSWWADNLKMLASLASERRDIEVYIAPNGEIISQYTKGRRIQVSHNKFMKAMSGRKIIYVGDFDGGDTPIELSWRNDVVWICPEDRYRRFLSHDWVHYDESRFHGVFIRAFTLEEMFEGLRKITRLNRLFIDLHEDERFSDD